MSYKNLQLYCPACFTEPHQVPHAYSSDAGRFFNPASVRCTLCITDAQNVPHAYSSDAGRFFKPAITECSLCKSDTQKVPSARSSDAGRYFTPSTTGCSRCKSDIHSVPNSYSSDAGRFFKPKPLSGCDPLGEFKVFYSQIYNVGVEAYKEELGNCKYTFQFRGDTCYNIGSYEGDYYKYATKYRGTAQSNRFLTTKLRPIRDTYKQSLSHCYTINDGEIFYGISNDKLTPNMMKYHASVIDIGKYNNRGPDSVFGDTPYASDVKTLYYNTAEEQAADFSPVFGNVVIPPGKLAQGVSDYYSHEGTNAYDGKFYLTGPVNDSGQQYPVGVTYSLPYFSSWTVTSESIMSYDTIGLCVDYVYPVDQYCSDYFYGNNCCCCGGGNSSDYGYYTCDFGVNCQAYNTLQTWHYKQDKDYPDGMMHPENIANCSIQFQLTSVSAIDGSMKSCLIPKIYNESGETIPYKIVDVPVVFETFEIFTDTNIKPDKNNIPIMVTECSDNREDTYWFVNIQTIDQFSVSSFPLMYSEYTYNGQVYKVVPTSWYDYIKLSSGDHCGGAALVTRLNKDALMAHPNGPFIYPKKKIKTLIYNDSYEQEDREVSAFSKFDYLMRGTYDDDPAADTLLYHEMTVNGKILNTPNKDYWVDYTNTREISAIADIQTYF